MEKINFTTRKMAVIACCAVNAVATATATVGARGSISTTATKHENNNYNTIIDKRAYVCLYVSMYVCIYVWYESMLLVAL